ncbi:MAG: hypothetical protein Crog4KO_02180 [Crocinitomicaceae bacterium]
MSFRYAFIAGIVAIVLMFFTLHSNFIGLDNGGTAHGQQGANLALTQGYVDNNLDFFHPQTKALNAASNDFQATPLNPSQRTAAPFPIHAYAAAITQKMTGCSTVTVYHWYNVIWGFVGLFFLYLLSLRITQNIGKSLFILVFFGTAPLLAFYQSAVMPEIPSFACLIAGTYFVYRFTSEFKVKHAHLGLLFLMLAAFTSPDLILYFIAALILILYQLYKQSKLISSKGYLLPVYGLFFLLETIRFASDRNSFGSQFPSLFEDWIYDQTTSNFIFSEWKMHYFTVFQTVVIGVLLVLLIFSTFRKSEAIRTSIQRYQIVIITVPSLLFAMASPYQVTHGDVFFIKTVLLFLILLILYVVDRFDLEIVYKYPKVAVPVFLFVLFMLIGEGNWTQTVRHEKARTSPGSEMAFLFKGGDELLLLNGVRKEDKLNVVIPRDSGIGHDVLANLNHTGIIREIPLDAPGPRFPKGDYVVCTLQERDVLYEHFQTKFIELDNNGSIVLFRAID